MGKQHTSVFMCMCDKRGGRGYKADRFCVFSTGSWQRCLIRGGAEGTGRVQTLRRSYC